MTLKVSKCFDMILKVLRSRPCYSQPGVHSWLTAPSEPLCPETESHLWAFIYVTLDNCLLESQSFSFGRLFEESTEQTSTFLLMRHQNKSLRINQEESLMCFLGFSSLTCLVSDKFSVLAESETASWKQKPETFRQPRYPEENR